MLLLLLLADDDVRMAARSRSHDDALLGPRADGALSPSLEWTLGTAGAMCAPHVHVQLADRVASTYVSSAQLNFELLIAVVAVVAVVASKRLRGRDARHASVRALLIRQQARARSADCDVIVTHIRTRSVTPHFADSSLAQNCRRQTPK